MDRAEDGKARKRTYAHIVACPRTSHKQARLRNTEGFHDLSGRPITLWYVRAADHYAEAPIRR